MKRGLGYYSIVFGSLVVAVSVVLGGLILISEGMIGVHYLHMPITYLIALLVFGLVLIVAGSRRFIAEKKEVRK